LRFLSATFAVACTCLCFLAASAPALANGSSITITSPIDGSNVSGPVSVSLTIGDRVGAANVYLDGNLYASNVRQALSWNSAAASDGNHVISTKAFSSNGRYLGGQSISVSVRNGVATPTVSATATPAPTSLPTTIPTTTTKPTPLPTVVPTVVPSAVPTVAPTALPTVMPTALPTVAPTSVPTVVPTSSPIQTPTVSPTPVPLAVAITGPANGAHIQGAISFAAVKESANVLWMNFYVDGTWIASSPPDAIVWDSTSVTDGVHSLSVKAFDASSNLLGNPAVLITVNNAAGTPTPTAKPTSSSSGSATPTPASTPVVDTIRPMNAIPNSKMPSASDLAAFNGSIGCGGLDNCIYVQKVDGQFTGTTAAILEHEADKWCPSCTIVNPLDGQTYSFRDLLKAIAVTESGWHEWVPANLGQPDPITGMTNLTPDHGDIGNVSAQFPNGGSWGIVQVKENDWPATFPHTAQSTAFDIDFKLAIQTGVEQGHLQYLSDTNRSQAAIANGHAPYVNYTDSNGVFHPAAVGDERRWGAVGNWFSGGWLSTTDNGYLSEIQRHLHDQTWTQQGF
jgi:hypothetical protein